MTCVCSLAGTSACASCFHNPNGIKQENNFMTWNTRAETSYKDALILLDELGLSERTCHIEYPYYGDAPVINGQPRCSECKTEFAVGTFPNYCPNCGAKVVEQ